MSYPRQCDFECGVILCNAAEASRHACEPMRACVERASRNLGLPMDPNWPATPPAPPAEDPAPGAATYDQLATFGAGAVLEVVNLRAEVARLREALVFYADPDNWRGKAGVIYNGPGASHSGWFLAETALSEGREGAAGRASEP